MEARSWKLGNRSGKRVKALMESLDHQSSHGSLALTLAVPLTCGWIRRRDDEGGISHFLNVGRPAILVDDARALAIGGDPDIPTIVIDLLGDDAGALAADDHGSADRRHGIGVAVLR